MAAKASKQGLEIIDQYRRKKGWHKYDRAWLIAAYISQSTLKRFWMRYHISQEIFKRICQAVGYEDWESIVDNTSFSEADFGRKFLTRLTIRKSRGVAQYYIENLGNNIELEMVKIPPGKFLMGSPEDELERMDREGPQHEVSVGEFFCGRYPITQGQWKQVVESTEQIERELDQDPSYFKDDYENDDRWSRPVEQVSWDDAQEFCGRLRQKTGRDYRLPSEAQWEYACRANTTTPFHFGETITTDLANYRGEDDEMGGTLYSGSYGRGPKGEYRQQTTPVDYFQAANGFGLYDMHGNVWEWCEDDWHDNYEGAPGDGSAWRSPNNTNTTKVVRGGSWNNFPRICRSAFRDRYNPVNQSSNIGLRVVRLNNEQ